MKSRQKTLISVGALIFHLALLFVVYKEINTKPAPRKVETQQAAFSEPRP